MSDAAGRAARAAYRPESPATRLHVGLRWRSCPFARIADALDGARHVLDVGCGHGLFPLYLALRDPAARIVGVDIDADKIEIGRAAAERLGVSDRVVFARVEPGWTPAAPIPGSVDTSGAAWDAVVIVDILYLLGHRAAATMVADAAAELGPGGRLVVKELDTRPGWKWRLSQVQEVLATKVLRITEGGELAQVGIEHLEPMVRAAGLVPTTTRLDRGHLHADYLSVGNPSRS